MKYEQTYSVKTLVETPLQLYIVLFPIFTGKRLHDHSKVNNYITAALVSIELFTQ